MFKIELVKGDITKLEVDAIVNAANSTLLGGGGVDGAIHVAAGAELLEECKTLGGCPVGEARITKGYNLPAKYVIHTVGPVFSKTEDRSLLLQAAYRNSLYIAKENGIRTIAFPNISTGVYRYPREEAARIAIKTVRDFCEEFGIFDRVIFCCFENENFEIYKKQMNL